MRYILIKTIFLFLGTFLTFCATYLTLTHSTMPLFALCCGLIGIFSLFIAPLSPIIPSDRKKTIISKHRQVISYRFTYQDPAESPVITFSSAAVLNILIITFIIFNIRQLVITNGISFWSILAILPVPLITFIGQWKYFHNLLQRIQANRQIKKENDNINNGANF